MNYYLEKKLRTVFKVSFLICLCETTMFMWDKFTSYICRAIIKSIDIVVWWSLIPSCINTSTWAIKRVWFNYLYISVYHDLYVNFCINLIQAYDIVDSNFVTLSNIWRCGWTLTHISEVWTGLFLLYVAYFEKSQYSTLEGCLWCIKLENQISYLLGLKITHSKPANYITKQKYKVCY